MIYFSWLWEFEQGFEHPDATTDGFDTNVDCDNRKGNTVPLGSKCRVKCKPVSIL